MIYLADIVDKINTVLKDKLPYSDARYFGLSNAISLKVGDKVITAPSVFEKNVYDGELIMNDDLYPYTIFHKAVNSTGLNKQKDLYGDGQLQSIMSTTDVDMIVLGFKSMVKVCPIQLLAVLVDNMPLTYIKQVDGTPVKLQTNITWISSNLDYRSVFNQNFQNMSFQVGPNEFILSARYRIEQSYFKGCLNNCEC